LASVNAQLGLGADNIVSLRGVNYSTEGGGNWMGIDYVRLHAAGDTGPQPAFVSSTISNGRVNLAWTGTAILESAPSVGGPWTPITPNPTSPYAEDIQSSQIARFYRLRQP
jgi:hypothetical protein